MGWDGHKTFSRVSGRDASGAVVWRERVEHRDLRALRQQLRRWPRGIPVVLEATFGWGWMTDELAAAGLDPHLAHSGKLAEWRRARRLAKSNRLDSDLLSELPSQRPNWWEVWLAPPAVREQRESMRHRAGMVQFQTALKNRVHAVLHRHGILHEHSDLFGVKGRRFLNQLLAEPNEVRVARGDRPLPDTARFALAGCLRQLDQARGEIAAATRGLRREVRGSPAAQRLRTIPGISWVLAHTIMAEIGRIERFATARHLASYSLMAPIAHDSGEELPDATPHGRHVGHVGRRTLKWAWIEAAHNAVRSGGRFKDLFDRRTNGGKRDRNRGYIAVGHELCRVAYVLIKKEIDFVDNPSPRPGSDRSRRQRIARSGTGQPDRPMADPAACGEVQTSS